MPIEKGVTSVTEQRLFYPQQLMDVMDMMSLYEILNVLAEYFTHNNTNVQLHLAYISDDDYDSEASINHIKFWHEEFTTQERHPIKLNKRHKVAFWVVSLLKQIQSYSNYSLPIPKNFIDWLNVFNFASKVDSMDESESVVLLVQFLIQRSRLLFGPDIDKSAPNSEDVREMYENKKRRSG